MTGRVLADTGREVTVSWKEIGGTVELKGFSMGPQRIVAVRCISWKLNQEECKQLEEQLGAAVERLAQPLPASAAAGASEGMPSRRTPFEEKA